MAKQVAQSPVAGGPSAAPTQSAPPTVAPVAKKRFSVRLHPGQRGEFTAVDAADAIAQYNLWSGVVASEHAHQVEEL